MLKSVLLASVTLFSLAGAVQAQDISAARISDDIKVLSSDAFEGRGITTPAEQKVIDYMSKGFAAAGFHPGGENGGWTQAVHLRQFVVSDPKLAFNFADGHSLDLKQGVDIVVRHR